MATYYSPRIVTDGLLFYVDGLNRKSYSGSGTAVLDLSGNGYTGALTNGTTITTDGSISLDGSDDYVNVSAGASILPTASYTKMAFINASSFATSNNIISGGNTGQHAFWLAGGTNFQAGHNGFWNVVVSTTSLVTGRWYFGAVSFSSTNGWKLYVNGVREATSASTTTFSGGTGNVYVGAYDAGNTFTGRISCPLVYSRELTADEVLQNFNAIRGRFNI